MTPEHLRPIAAYGSDLADLTPAIEARFGRDAADRVRDYLHIRGVVNDALGVLADEKPDPLGPAARAEHLSRLHEEHRETEGWLRELGERLDANPDLRAAMVADCEAELEAADGSDAGLIRRRLLELSWLRGLDG